jgi:hypothetical protein
VEGAELVVACIPEEDDPVAPPASRRWIGASGSDEALVVAAPEAAVVDSTPSAEPRRRSCTGAAATGPALIGPVSVVIGDDVAATSAERWRPIGRTKGRAGEEVVAVVVDIRCSDGAAALADDGDDAGDTSGRVVVASGRRWTSAGVGVGVDDVGGCSAPPRSVGASGSAAVPPAGAGAGADDPSAIGCTLTIG